VQLERLVRAVLEASYTVIVAASSSLIKLAKKAIDVVVVDLEPLDFGLLAEAQRRYPEAAFVAICGGYREADCIEVLERGAEYLARPFRKHDLLARVRVAELRRFNATGSARCYRNGSLVVDLLNQRVHSAGQPVDLSPSQSKVLMFLASRAGSPASYDSILGSLDIPDSPSARRALQSLVVQLRRRIEQDRRHPEILLTETRFGYRFASPPDQRPSLKADHFEQDRTTGKRQ
jgi:DNA-binding response OmpR family regulator